MASGGVLGSVSASALPVGTGVHVFCCVVLALGWSQMVLYVGLIRGAALIDVCQKSWFVLVTGSQSEHNWVGGASGWCTCA